MRPPLGPVVTHLVPLVPGGFRHPHDGPHAPGPGPRRSSKRYAGYHYSRSVAVAGTSTRGIGRSSMTINFTMSDEQKKLQYDVRAFAENVLKPARRRGRRRARPAEGLPALRSRPTSSRTRPGSRCACCPPSTAAVASRASTWSIAGRGICVVDPSFACTVLCNELGLHAGLPDTAPRSRSSASSARRPQTTRASTSVGWTAEQPPGNPPAPPTSTSRCSVPPGSLLPRLATRLFRRQRRKYWPSSAAGRAGVNADPDRLDRLGEGGTEDSPHSSSSEHPASRIAT